MAYHKVTGQLTLKQGTDNPKSSGQFLLWMHFCNLTDWICVGSSLMVKGGPF